MRFPTPGSPGILMRVSMSLSERWLRQFVWGLGGVAERIPG